MMTSVIAAGNTSPGQHPDGPGPGSGEHDPAQAAPALDPIQKVIEEFDPQGELDPDQALLDRCATTAHYIRELYKGTEISDTFLPELYQRELMYVRNGIDSAVELQRMYRESHDGRDIGVLNILFDLDRSQVAVADTPSGDFVHIPRPGWKTMIEGIEKALPMTRIDAGVLSDRMQKADPDQVSGDNNLSLEEQSRKVFESAGIQDFFVPSLAISCTDGPTAERLPKFLQSGMRRVERKLQPLSLLQVESGQFDAIGSLIDLERVGDTDLEYHAKLGIILILVKETGEDNAFMLFDDLRSVSILKNSRAMGVCIEPPLQPLLPDEGHIGIAY